MEGGKDGASCELEPPKPTLLKFYPLSTLIDASFWSELQRIKLEVLQLDTGPIKVCGSLRISPNTQGLVTLNYQCFKTYSKLIDERHRSPLDCDELFFPGEVFFFNSEHEFDASEKRQLIMDSIRPLWNTLWESQLDNDVDSRLEFYLARFLMIIYSDCKSYEYKYWCAYPSFSFPDTCFQLGSSGTTWQQFFNQTELSQLIDAYSELPLQERFFFATTIVNFGLETAQVKVVPFTQLWTELESYAHQENLKLIFVFTGSSPTEKHPGWLLRNYLAYIVIRMIQVLRRNENSQNLKTLVENTFSSLTVASISTLQTQKQNKIEALCRNSAVFQIKLSLERQLQKMTLEAGMPPVVGWERNKNAMNRLEPSYVNLQAQLKPSTLAKDALLLNLKLMKWRLAPELDLDRIQKAKCLLLGAGTLGCNVARGLVAWGVNHITFVDSKTVSYSNPARQSLYTYHDAVGGKTSKAYKAAEALKQINPDIDSSGIELNINMPGHFTGPDFWREIEQLEQLIEVHDVVFLLTDTRESRWLPTLIASAKHKITINVALGFDTFLVQRHGLKIRLDNESDQQTSLYQLYEQQVEAMETFGLTDRVLGNDLGCYFCSDVIAPGDSTKNRTLDQQCTVTRPGLSMIAAGYAVELFVSLLQHPAKGLAPAPSPSISKECQQCRRPMIEKQPQTDRCEPLLNLDGSPLGVIPHQFRGFLSRFDHMMTSYRAFDSCAACSDSIIDQYRENRVKFLETVMHNPRHLEEVAGLDRYQRIADDIQVLDSDEEDDLLGLEIQQVKYDDSS